MHRLLRRATVVAAGTVLGVVAATGPLMTNAAGPEVDVAELTYGLSTGGFTCTFLSPDEGLGSCTVQQVSLGATCLGVVPLLRNGIVELTEPSAEVVHLAGKVVGGGSGSAVVVTGTDGFSTVAGGGVFAASCGHFGQLTSLTILLAWAAA